VDNPAFTFAGEHPQKFVNNFFGINNFMEKKYTLGNLKLTHFFDRSGSCVNHDTVSVLLGFRISTKNTTMFTDVLTQYLRVLPAQFHLNQALN
jgi:hypothetical protein